MKIIQQQIVGQIGEGEFFAFKHGSPSSLSSACAASAVSTWADSSELHRPSRPVPLESVSSCGQPFVSQPLSADGSDHAVQPLGCVVLYVAFVQPPCKFIGIASNMLGADVVEGAVNAPLENGPNGFDAVSGGNSPRVFASGMIDGFMLEKQPVKIREHNPVIGIELRPKFNVVVNLSCDGLHSALIHRGKDGASVTFTHSKHSSFADSTATSFQLFVLMLVPFLAADETLIKFHDALQFRELRATASLAYPMENEPRALLRDADLFRQLQRTDALTGCYEQVHGVQPLVKRDMGTLEDGSRSDGEVNLTGIAAIETALSGSDSLAGLASRTDSAIGPEPRFQIEPCRLRIGEHLEQLERADCAFAHRLLVCFRGSDAVNCLVFFAALWSLADRRSFVAHHPTKRADIVRGLATPNTHGRLVIALNSGVALGCKSISLTDIATSSYFYSHAFAHALNVLDSRTFVKGVKYIIPKELNRSGFSTLRRNHFFFSHRQRSPMRIMSPSARMPIRSLSSSIIFTSSFVARNEIVFIVAVLLCFTMFDSVRQR